MTGIFSSTSLEALALTVSPTITSRDEEKNNHVLAEELKSPEGENILATPSFRKSKSQRQSWRSGSENELIHKQ